MIRPPSISTLFPYTTLFRSEACLLQGGNEVALDILELHRARDYSDGPGQDEPRRIHDKPNSQPTLQIVPYIEAIQWKPDRKSTRLNSSHTVISYAVFCLKKK